MIVTKISDNAQVPADLDQSRKNELAKVFQQWTVSCNEDFISKNRLFLVHSICVTLLAQHSTFLKFNLLNC